MNPKEKVVLVTGGATGVGFALAQAFARAGAKVAICGRRQEKLDAAAERLAAEGAAACGLRADITLRADVDRLRDAIEERWGPVEILFNNAGSFRCIAGLHEADPDAWWGDVTVNLLGTFLVCRALLPAMIERDRGVVINMDGGKPAGGSAYGCSKAGVGQMIDILVKELEILKSNVLAYKAGPGLVRTEMTEMQAGSEAGRRWIPSTADLFESGKTFPPEAVAEKTIEMLSHASVENRGRGYGPTTDFSDW